MNLTKIFAAVALVVAAGTASAAPVTWSFSQMPYGGVTPTNGVDCTGGDKCSTKGGFLHYQPNGSPISMDASATFWDGSSETAAVVVQDHISRQEFDNEGGAGLGVYSTNPLQNNDDNITVYETLKLTFSQVVYLNSVNLFSEGHSANWNQTKVFQFSIDNSSWDQFNLAATKTWAGDGVSSANFYFRFARDENNVRLENADEFYLGAVEFNPSPGGGLNAVPEPETYAMMLAGLGLMGAVARRRKAKAV